MRTREFRVLDEDDRAVIDRVAPGLGNDAARVLAYLLLHSDIEDGPATEIELRIGTGLNRSAITAAVDGLESAGVVERTTVPDDGPGRPPTAWRATTDLESAARNTAEHHASALLERARGIWEGGSSGESGKPDESGGATETLTLGLNWKPNGLHLPFYAAAASGRYGDFGLAVEIDHHEGSRRAPDAVVSGEADVGLVGAATVVRARAAGEPIVPIAVAYRRAMAVLYTVRERFGEVLSGVAQLRGRRIGMPARSETRVLGRLFLNQVALDGSVRIVDTAGEEQDALLSGEVDVVTGSISDPRELERRGMTVDTLAVADHFPIYGPTLVVSQELLAARERALERFLAGTTAGWAEARLDSTSAAGRIDDRSADSSERVARTFERAFEEFGGVCENGWGWQRAEPWDRLRTALTQGTLLSESGGA